MQSSYRSDETKAGKSWLKWTGQRTASGPVWEHESPRSVMSQCQGSHMKTLLLVGRDHATLACIIRNTLLALLLAGAAAAYGGVPSMNVIVSDAGGKVAFKGTTTANASFATANLAPGNYVVQFQSKSEDLKSSQYLAVGFPGQKK